jgi:hypothetical protein
LPILVAIVKPAVFRDSQIEGIAEALEIDRFAAPSWDVGLRNDPPKVMDLERSRYVGHGHILARLLIPVPLAERRAGTQTIVL